MDSDTFYALVLMLLGFGLSQSKEPYWHYYTFQFIQESGFTDSDTFYALVLMLLGFGLSQSKEPYWHYYTFYKKVVSWFRHLYAWY
jgi:hypothetical protein